MKARKYAEAKRPATTGLVALVLGLGSLALGCGGEEWQPSGVGPSIDPETQAIADPTKGASMSSDLMAMPSGSGVEHVQSALSGGAGGSSGSTTNGGEPNVFYLFYATGKDLPTTNYNACQGTPPKFDCAFAPTLVECQRQIQAYLDKWYADMNIIFTLTRPTSGKFYTEVVSSGGGAWCDVDAKVAGVAPFLC
ncbi:MAG TPA: hypothetical protein VK989_04410, partial [Polyangia bacterium]|nr:hypothetical protein [Polyangia bacterium]